eukprot:TRINITY_DN66852_c2_g9_i1.p1 TRINITY_DN66852_c2_g9~~TRINITY_DN66852_c2_g9_i1.p1  ORF type:complete len:496 (+),score=244.98 TRINITY_DN66852_c2_g9_i1:164-1489(+)
MDINKLAAKARKAQLMGKKDEYERLTKQIEEMRKTDVVVVSGLDDRGRMRTVASATEQVAQTEALGPKPAFQRKRRAPDRVDERGNRLGYFQRDLDDSKVDVRELAQRERLGTGSGDLDRNLARSIAANSKYSGMSLDEQFDSADHSMAQYESRDAKLKGHDRVEWERKQAVAAHQRHERVVANCYYCSSSPKFSRHLVVTTGVRAFLAVPSIHRVNEWHCLLVPMEHTVAMNEADENVQEEIDYFRKCLVKMYAKHNQRCIFMEHVVQRKKRHTVVHCVGVPADVYQQAPIHFKRALLEADEEWSAHKKLIDLGGGSTGKPKRSVRRAIPPNFPYFAVEFGLNDGGFAHVIEEEGLFSDLLGLETCCSMLEIPSQLVLRAKRAGLERERQRAAAFGKLWHPFNWTRVHLNKNKNNGSKRKHQAESSSGDDSQGAKRARTQ